MLSGSPVNGSCPTGSNRIARNSDIGSFFCSTSHFAVVAALLAIAACISSASAKLRMVRFLGSGCIDQSRSPGHHDDGGLLAVILVARNATRALRLYG